MKIISLTEGRRKISIIRGEAYAKLFKGAFLTNFPMTSRVVVSVKLLQKSYVEILTSSA